MSELVRIVTPEIYFRHMFTAKAALDGGVVRRSIADIERVMPRGTFIAEMKRRGFSTVENAGQFVVFCNCEPVRRVS